MKQGEYAMRMGMQVICEEDQVRGRWKEYFASLFQANGEMQQRVSREVSGGEAQIE